MLFIGPGSDEATDAHDGYVAGRYRNGALSDIWTDVTRCAYATFTAYVPACECGWTGGTHPPTAEGLARAQLAWVHQHFLVHIVPTPAATHHDAHPVPRVALADPRNFIGWQGSHATT